MEVKSLENKYNQVKNMLINVQEYNYPKYPFLTSDDEIEELFNYTCSVKNDGTNKVIVSLLKEMKDFNRLFNILIEDTLKIGEFLVEDYLEYIMNGRTIQTINDLIEQTKKFNTIDQRDKFLNAFFLLALTPEQVEEYSQFIVENVDNIDPETWKRIVVSLVKIHQNIPENLLHHNKFLKDNTPLQILSYGFYLPDDLMKKYQNRLSDIPTFKTKKYKQLFSLNKQDQITNYCREYKQNLTQAIKDHDLPVSFYQELGIFHTYKYHIESTQENTSSYQTTFDEINQLDNIITINAERLLKSAIRNQLLLAHDSSIVLYEALTKNLLEQYNLDIDIVKQKFLNRGSYPIFTNGAYSVSHRFIHINEGCLPRELKKGVEPLNTIFHEVCHAKTLEPGNQKQTKFDFVMILDLLLEEELGMFAAKNSNWTYTELVAVREALSKQFKFIRAWDDLFNIETMQKKIRETQRNLNENKTVVRTYEKETTSILDISELFLTPEIIKNWKERYPILEFNYDEYGKPKPIQSLVKKLIELDHQTKQTQEKTPFANQKREIRFLRDLLDMRLNLTHNDRLPHHLRKEWENAMFQTSDPVVNSYTKTLIKKSMKQVDMIETRQ